MTNPAWTQHMKSLNRNRSFCGLPQNIEKPSFFRFVATLNRRVKPFYLNRKVKP
jgi:hypothetical protein